MHLSPGTRIGHYEITGALGVGGMGEVYRARDTRLDRSVAIKVLPEAFAGDPDRLIRFEREAKTLAALNHPNIAQIHGIEEGRALVMELVEGEDLAQRLIRGPVPFEEAIPISQQIVDALEAAHDLGIIHRDLKPANVKIRPDGRVKVLDFGLAKAMESPAPAGTSLDSPTFTSPAMTQLGVILGTAAYMSPEQARGKPVDRRADIWAFGCVLYEMLAGKRPFAGDDISMTLAAVLKENVDFTALPNHTPPSLRRLLRRCLEKDPRRRLSAIADARLELDERDDAPERRVDAAGPAWRMRVIWGAGGVLAGALLFAIVAGTRVRPPDGSPVIRSELSFPSTPLTLSMDRSLALSPDGSTLVFTGGPLTEPIRLYRRPLAEETVTPIHGTDGATSPFFSPDGQWIGFRQNSHLKKIPVGGGAAIDYGDANGHQGGSFSGDGTLIFNRQHGEGLLRVRPDSTTPEVLTTINRAAGEAGHHWPHILPDGRHALYTLEIDGKPYSEARIMLLTLDSGQSRPLIDGGADARYVRTGHIVYWRLGDLWAVPFDLRSLRLTGSPVMVVRNVMLSEANGHAEFTVADNGTLVYLAGPDSEGNRTLVMTDRTGTARPLTTERKAYEHLVISPDGSRVALTVVAANDSLWTLEVDRRVMTRITFEGESSRPVWAPDGKRLLFARHMGGEVRKIFSVPADGGVPPELIRDADRSEVPDSWSAAAKVLAFTRLEDRDAQDIWVMPMDGDRKPRRWLSTRFSESQPRFSPDGQWIAYISDESGRQQIYVRSFDGSNKRQISVDGGVEPRWRGDGRELFYRIDDTILSTQVTQSNGALRFSVPSLLFKTQGEYLIANSSRTWGSWDVMPDGQHFVFIQDFSKPRSTVILVQNWFAELKSKFPR